MKRWWNRMPCGLVALAILSLPVASRPARAAAADPSALVEAERAFAAEAAATSVRDAFLHWLAPTAVVFSPAPVNAHKLYGSQPADRTRLAWVPEVATISAGGDLGWTSGPWEFRVDSTHTAPDVTGTFFSVWKRQPDGRYLNVLDAGIPHPAEPLTGVTPLLRALPAQGAGRSALSNRKALWKADADLARAVAADGFGPALAAVAAPDVRALRRGSLPIVGRDAVRDSSAAHHDRATLMSLAQFVAESGDLGYTYGSFVEPGAAGADSSFYVHVWHRDGRAWQLALDLLIPAPKAKK